MKNTNLNIKSVKLQRTAVIGIGGSGAEPIVSNRRRTIDQFGSWKYAAGAASLPGHRPRLVSRAPLQDWSSGCALETEYVDIQFQEQPELYRGIRRAVIPTTAGLTSTSKKPQERGG